MAKAYSFLEFSVLTYLLLLLLPSLKAFKLTIVKGSGEGVHDDTEVRVKKGLSFYEESHPRKSEPVLTPIGLKRRIGIIADLDKVSTTNGSRLRRGYLFIKYNPTSPKLSSVSVEWDSGEPLEIRPGLNLKGRGMELSELFTFNSKLYTCDDRTGVVYEVPDAADTPEKVICLIPWVILADGNGAVAKGFKCEWGCVKGEYLWIGGNSRPLTTDTGEIKNLDSQFVKKISSTGEVTHLDWKINYERMSSKLGISFPGYVAYESGGWSNRLNEWMFLPRRASTEAYDGKTDERMSTNIILFANEDFTDIDVRTVGEIVPTHGFSTFKWIPGTNDQLVVALKSVEVEDKTATYLLVFDIYGNIILPETKVEDQKYEGIEFL